MGQLALKPVALTHSPLNRPHVLLPPPRGGIHQEQWDTTNGPAAQTGRTIMAGGVHYPERFTPCRPIDGRCRHAVHQKPNEWSAKRRPTPYRFAQHRPQPRTRSSSVDRGTTGPTPYHPSRVVQRIDNNNRLQQVTSAEIRSAIQIGPSHDNLVAQGYSLD
jgi:hypothetical protein